MAKSVQHVYWRGGVTDERIEQFAGASLTEQRATLAELRQRASSDEAGINIGIFGLLVAALVAFLPPVRQLITADPFLQIISSATLGIVLALAFVPLILPVILASTKRSMAAALLGAYEDELARRHRDRRWANREWRQQH